MNAERFENIVNQQLDICKNILCNKAKEYADDNDRLHNFKNAAGMMGCNPKEALAGMMAKHTISIYDMCRDGRQHSMDIWQEKITDHINYLLLLKAIVVEEMTEKEMNDLAEDPVVQQFMHTNFDDIPFMNSNLDDIPHSVTYDFNGGKVE